MECYNQSLALDPLLSPMHIKAEAVCHTALNRFAEAEADLNQALEYAPDDADAKQRLDFLHKKQELAGRS